MAIWLSELTTSRSSRNYKRLLEHARALGQTDKTRLFPRS